MEIYLVKRDFGLYPANDEDADKVRKMKIGVPYKCSVVMPRNYQFHKKFFALLNCGFSYINETQMEHHKNFDGFRESVLLAAGHCETRWDIKRSTFYEVAKSISFASVDEATFNDIYDRVKDVLFSYALNGASEQEFLNNLINF